MEHQDKVENQKQFKLRGYQDKAVDKILTNNVHDEFVISNPTGTGKMMIFIELMNNFEKQGHKCLYLTGFGVLINDLKNRFGKPINVLKGTDNEIHDDSLIYISTYQTMQNRLHQVDLKNCILLLDESKAFDGKMYNKIIDNIEPSKIIHSSATPYDSRGVSLYRNAIDIKTISIKEAEDKNYRVPLKTYIPTFTNRLNFEDVDKVGTEYNQEQLSQVMTENWYLEEFKNWINNLDLKNRTTLVVTTSIDQTELTYDQIDGIDYIDTIKKKNNDDMDLFNVKEDHEIDTSNKIIKARVHSKRNEKENKEILDAFYDGKIDIVVSASKLTTGYDNPRIDTFIALRPTLQRNLFNQMISRAVRPFDGKEYADFFDLGNLTINHGLYSWEDDFKASNSTRRASKYSENFKVPEVHMIQRDDEKEFSEKILYSYRDKLKTTDLSIAGMSRLFTILLTEKDFSRMVEAGGRLYMKIHGLKKSTYDWVFDKLYETYKNINDQDAFQKAIRKRIVKIIFTDSLKDLFYAFYATNHEAILDDVFHFPFKPYGTISDEYKEKFDEQSMYTSKIDFIKNELNKELATNQQKDNIKTLMYIYMLLANDSKIPKFAGLYYFIDWVLGSDSPYQLHIIKTLPGDDLLDIDESEIPF